MLRQLFRHLLNLVTGPVCSCSMCEVLRDELDLCASCGQEHSYMSGPCEHCGGNRFRRLYDEYSFH